MQNSRHVQTGARSTRRFALAALAALVALTTLTLPAPEWDGTELSAQTGYRPGQRIEGRWRPNRDWEPAVMVEPGTDGFHLVRWDTNNTPERVQASMIRPAANAPAMPVLAVGARVQACTGSYSCLAAPGVVTEIGQGNEVAMYKVRFADGTSSWRNAYTEITAPARAAGPGPRAPAGTQGTAARAPGARRALPAAVPTGRYRCYLVAANTQYTMNVGGGVTEHQGVGYPSAMGVVEVTGPTTYRWGTQTTAAQPGAFRYDRASGRITFGAGPYRPAQFRGEFGWNASDGNAVITLYQKSQRNGELKQHCIRQ